MQDDDDNGDMKSVISEASGVQGVARTYYDTLLIRIRDQSHGRWSHQLAGSCAESAYISMYGDEPGSSTDHGGVDVIDDQDIGSESGQSRAPSPRAVAKHRLSAPWTRAASKDVSACTAASSSRIADAAVSPSGIPRAEPNEE